MEVEIPNLNPNRLLIINQDQFNQVIKDMEAKDLLDLCPRYLLTNPTLLYHFSDKVDENFSKFGTKKVSLPSYDNTTDFYFNLNEYQSNSYVDVLYNNDELKVLDFSFIAAEMGFNPIDLTEKEVMRYCKKNHLDGFITLKESDDYDIQCYTENDKNWCPVLYLNKFTKIRLLGIIGTKKGKKYLTYDEMIVLFNLLLCNIVALLKRATPTVDFHLRPQLFGQQIDTNVDLAPTIYIKNYINLLNLNHINLNDPLCEEELFVQSIRYDYPKTDYLLTLKNIHYNNDVFYDKNDNKIDYYISDPIYHYVFNKLSKKYNLTPFAYSHYNMFSHIKGYEKYTFAKIEEKGVLPTITALQEDVVNKLYQHYKSNKKSINLNMINIEYIPSTYSYLIKEVFSELSIKNAANILTYKKISDEIKDLFNADKFYISIINSQYTKAKDLFDDLMNDLISYKRNQGEGADPPTINYAFLKWFRKVTGGNEKIKIYINNIILHLYDIYKSFIKDGTGIQFDNLYNQLGIDILAAIFAEFAAQYHLPKSLIDHFADFVKVEELKHFLTDDITPDFFDQLRSSILTLILKKKLMTFYQLPSSPLTKKFLDYNIELLMNREDSQNLLTNENVDWYLFFTNPPIDMTFTDQLLQRLNNNGDMLTFIYDELKLNLTTQRAGKILPLITQNLYLLYIEYLNDRVTLDELKKLIYVKEEKKEEEEEKEELEEKKKKKEKTKKSKRKSSTPSASDEETKSI